MKTWGKKILAIYLASLALIIVAGILLHASGNTYLGQTVIRTGVYWLFVWPVGGVLEALTTAFSPTGYADYPFIDNLAKWVVFVLVVYFVGKFLLKKFKQAWGSLIGGGGGGKSHAH